MEAPFVSGGPILTGRPLAEKYAVSGKNPGYVPGQSLQVLIEEIEFEPFRRVQDSCLRLLVVGEDATTERFLHVWEEVVVGVCQDRRIGPVRQQPKVTVYGLFDHNHALALSGAHLLTIC